MATNTAQKTGVSKKEQGPAPDTIKKAEQQKKREEKNKKRDKVLAFIKANAAVLAPIMDELKLFIHEPGSRGRAKGSGILSKVRDMLLAADKTAGVSELAIFKAFHIGRTEMAGNIRKMILADPAERVWAKLDEKKEAYFVVAKSESTPKDWDGYVPAKKEEL